MKKLMITFLALAFLGVISCEKEEMEEPIVMEEEEDPECKTEGITYDGEIEGILSGCTGSSCHGGNTSRSMANYADAVAYAKRGRILGALNRESGFSPMPKNGSKLAQCKIDQVKAWIDADYPEG